MIKSTFFMSASTVARLLTGVVLFVWMARLWGVNTFGTFVYPFTVASLAVMLVDYGFSLQVVRDIGRAPGEVETIVHGKLSAKLFLALVLVVGAAIIGPVTVSSWNTLWLLWLLLAAAVLNSFGLFLNLAFRGIGRFGEETKVVLLSNLMHFVVVGAILEVGGGPVAVALGFVLSRALYLSFAIVAYEKVIGRVRLPAVDMRRTFLELTAGLPFGVFVALGTIYFQIDTVILQHFLGAQAVGLYQAGIRILMAGLVLPDVLSSVYLPAIAGSSGDSAKTVRMGIRLTRHLLMLGVLGLTALTLLGGWLVGALFGAEYQAISKLVHFFGIVLLLRYVASSYGLLLTVGDRQVGRTLIVGATCVVSVTLNTILVSSYGLRGAVVASVLTHVFLLTTYFGLVLHAYHCTFLDLRSLLLSGLATLIVILGSDMQPTIVVATVIALTTAGLGLKRGEITTLTRRLAPQFQA